MNSTKRVVTENERNAIFTTLTPEECLLLGRSLKDLCSEYKENDGTIVLNSFIPVLGKLPVILETPDTDAMIESADARNLYITKANSVFNFIEYEVQHGHI